MRKFAVLACVMLALSAASVPCRAASSRVAFTAKATTLGIGADLSINLASRVSLRLSGQKFGYDRSDTYGDIDYDSGVDLETFGALVDLHPFKGAFRVTAGLFANGNGASSVARLDPSTTYEIGGSTFTGAEIGDLSASMEFDSTVPYVGIGWGNPFAKSRRLGFAFGLGVIRQGSPDLSLTASNPLLDPILDQEIENELQRVADDFEYLEYYPVVSSGLTIRF
jgi:hypothetical protein